MIKLFAILTVLAALPVSALANQVATSKTGVLCDLNKMKDGLVSVHTDEQVEANKALSARQ